MQHIIPHLCSTCICKEREKKNEKKKPTMYKLKTEMEYATTFPTLPCFVVSVSRTVSEGFVFLFQIVNCIQMKSNHAKQTAISVL